MFRLGFFFFASIVSLAAQTVETVPRYELYVGVSYLRVHASGAEDSQVVGLPDFLLGQKNINFNLYGWDSSVTENVNKWFGAEFDASGFYGTPQPTFLCSASTLPNARSCATNNPVRPGVITKIHTFTFGPRFTFNRNGRLVPFAHVLAGVGRIDGAVNHTSIALPIRTILPQDTSSSNSALAIMPGFGLDLNVRDNFSVRVFEVDYLMTRFYNQRQDNGRVSVGFLWHFGTR